MRGSYKLNKIKLLIQWMTEDICTYGKYNRFVEVIDSDTQKYDDRQKFRLYTDVNIYTIVAHDRRGDGGYLGCQASTRKPRAGEDWHRGSDLPDGKFTRATWESIKNGILSYELCKLSELVAGEVE